jgi:hypothetical protein
MAIMTVAMAASLPRQVISNHYIPSFAWRLPIVGQQFKGTDAHQDNRQGPQKNEAAERQIQHAAEKPDQ